MTETPNTVHGRLLEAVHLSGYSFERACSELKWLLADDRWKAIGGGFDDVHEFLATIDLAGFKHALEDRKDIARLLVTIGASQRETAKLLGVSHTTVERDLRVGTNVPPAGSEPAEDKALEDAGGTNVPSAWFQKDVDPAALADAAAAQEDREKRVAAQKEANAAVRSARVAMPDGKFDVIVMDPPWPMEKIERDVAPNQVGFDYPTMSEEALVAYGDEVKARAADDCHLFLWTTQKFLPFALGLTESWGFRYVCQFTWHKPGGFQPFGLPQYNSEFVIYARLGTPKFDNTKNFFCCFDAPRREHSRKPDEFYETVARVTFGRRADWFARAPRAGFEVVGNETEKFEAVAE